MSSTLIPTINTSTVNNRSELVSSDWHEKIAKGVNTSNNRGYAMYQGRLVEVVRRGGNNTRIRTTLNGNDTHFLVPSAELQEYYHPRNTGVLGEPAPTPTESDATQANNQTA